MSNDHAADRFGNPGIRVADGDLCHDSANWGSGPFWAFGSYGDPRHHSPDRCAASCARGLPSAIIAGSGESASAMELVGPSALVLVPGVIEDATTGEEMTAESALNVVLVDFNQEVMQHLRDFNPAEDCQGIQFFSQDSMDIIPRSSSLLADAHQWIADAQEERVQFYSAAEELVLETLGAKTRAPALRKSTPKKPQTRVTNAMLAEQVQSLTSILPSISNQLESLQTNQAKLESMILQTGASQKIPPYRQLFPAAPLNPGGITAPAHFLQAVGSPPLGRTRQTSSPRVLKPPRLPGEEPQVLPSEEGYLEQVAAAQAPQMSDVFLQQSQALTTLMAHMVSQDGLGDFGASSSSTTSLSLKGSAKRDRLQQDLAGRKGGFLLKVAQNAHRRLRPSEAAPTTLEEFQGTPVFGKYLEKHGGFSSAWDLGLKPVDLKTWSSTTFCSLGGGSRRGPGGGKNQRASTFWNPLRLEDCSKISHSSSQSRASL